MKNCNPAFTPGARPERLLNLPENNLLDEESKWRNQSIAGATMYIAQVSWYDTLYAVGHLAKGMSKPSKAYMGVAKHLLRYLAESTDFSITYKQGGFKLAACSDTNWRNNPDNGKSKQINIVVHRHARERPNQLKGGTSRPHRSVNNGSGARRSCANNERGSLLQAHDAGAGFKEGFNGVPLFIDNTSALNVAGDRTYFLREQHIALKYVFIQERVEDGTITIHYAKTQDQLADIGTNRLNKQRHRELIKKIKDFGA